MTTVGPVTTIGMVVHGERAQAAELARDDRGMVARTGTPRGPARGGRGPRRSRRAAWRPRGSALEADVVLSLGGDGTMLRSVDLVAAHDVPVIGINVGQLGYLTEVDPADWERALTGWLAGEAEVDERMLLAVRVEPADGRTRSGPHDRAQRGGAREDPDGPHRADAGAPRRHLLHDLRRRRADRGHPYRIDRLLAVGPRSDRRAAPPGPAAHARVAAHALRPHPGPRAGHRGVPRGLRPPTGHPVGRRAQPGRADRGRPRGVHRSRSHGPAGDLRRAATSTRS